MWIARASCDSKLSPVSFVENETERLRPVSVGPKCVATYVSPRRTCPKTCPYRGGSCYALAGYTGRLMRRLDAWKGPKMWAMGDLEAGAIMYAFRRGVPQDGAQGGRDLRLHVGGDVRDEKGARSLAVAAVAFQYLGGGAVWTYTRRWREVAREVWGPIAVTASLDRPEDWKEAYSRGYTRAALVVALHGRLGRKRSYVLKNGLFVVPCRHDVTGQTCVECRRCLQAESRGEVVAFVAHGAARLQARRIAEEGLNSGARRR